MNGADILVDILTRYEVEVIFGVPGDTNVALYQALRKAEGRLRHVLCRDERSAVFMADCYARISGKVGVVEVPSGAGALYALPGIAEAEKSSVPVILLVNDIPQPGVGRGTLTELPVEALFKPVSKHAETLTSATKLPEMVRRAFRKATAGRPGAVVLALPEDLLYQQLAEGSYSAHVEIQCSRAPAYRTIPSHDALAAAAEAISLAKRPLVVAGGGANRSRAGAAITAFAERLSIPVVSTITGQGVMRDDHDLAIGIIGDNGFHPHAIEALRESDLPIYIGCRMGSVATAHWSLPVPGATTGIVQIDLEPETIGNSYSIEFPLAGDAAATMTALSALIKSSCIDPAWVRDINRRRVAFWQEMAPYMRTDTTPLRPERVFDALDRMLPSPCNIISDAGTATPYSTRFLRLKDARSRLVIPRFFGGLGYALPAIAGAYYAEPEVRPVALFGDGSLGMSAGELETIARERIPAVMIHFNNSCFGWIKALQRVTNPAGSNDGTHNVDFSPNDMSRLADVYGIRSFRIETGEQLAAALEEAFASDAPCFLDVVVESIADRLPPVMSWLKKVGIDPTKIGAQAEMVPAR